MVAEITYNAGKSYTLGKYRFVQGITRKVSDEKVIKRLSNMAGFAVRILKTKKVVREVTKAPAKKAAVKKTTK